MADEYTRLADSITGLCLDARTPKRTASTSNHSNPTQQSLIEAVQTLVQSYEATSAHAQQVKSWIESTHTPNSQDTVKLAVSLRRRATALASATKAFNDATEHYIITYISSLAGPETLVHKMLTHFTDKVRNIVGDRLDNTRTSDDSNILRETLETCYAQALDTSGVLRSDNYFIPLREASLGWPYDADFEGEDYYEHENRIAIDDGYAAAFRARRERKSEKERQQGEEWVGFWVHTLSECPDGPTLFYSPECRLAHVPRYLFRVFDDESSGRSDHHVVASAESISPIVSLSQRSRVDLLSRPKEEIPQMLHSHLTKPCFARKEKDATDNLMSWSSSLLFIIQYAIWRCHIRKCDPSEVEICMVDTRKFPRGQFARDKSLLRACHDVSSSLDGDAQSFFRFRLHNAYYDNGEYLSQGVVHHAGRSSVASLAQLIQAGLHDLYPEFADPGAMSSWAKRVGVLRARWSVRHTTTQLDIRRAVEMARACFGGFDASDVALVLLSFKNRKLRVSATEGGVPNVQGRRRKFDDVGPAEVGRYMAIVETVMSKDRGCLSALRGSASDSQRLGRVLECSE